MTYIFILFYSIFQSFTLILLVEWTDHDTVEDLNPCNLTKHGKSESPPSVLLRGSIAQFILLFPHFSPFYWFMFSFGARRYFYCFGFCDMFLFWLRSAEWAHISCTSAQFALASLWCSSVIRPKSRRWPSSTSSLRITLFTATAVNGERTSIQTCRVEM